MPKREFLLRGEAACKLYRTVVEDLPYTVFLPFLLPEDAHHAAPADLADLLCLDTPENRALLALAGGEVPAGASHYELFRALCAAYPRLAGHPLAAAARETLEGVFGIAQSPSEEHCDALWQETAAALFARRVAARTVFCPDALFAIEKAAFSDTVSALSAAYGVKITDLASLEAALSAALDAFAAAGGTLADHGEDTLTTFTRPDPYHAGEALAAALAGKPIDGTAAALWRCQLSRILGRAYVKRGVTLLLHTSKDTERLLSYLAREAALPRTVADIGKLPRGAFLPLRAALAENGKYQPLSAGFFGGGGTKTLRARVRRAAGEAALGALCALPDVRAGGRQMAEQAFFRRALCDTVGGFVRAGTCAAADAPALVRAVCDENVRELFLS